MITFLASFVLAAHPIEPQSPAKQKKRTQVSDSSDQEKAALQQLIDEANRAESLKK